jgi:hypothetical protein
MKNYFLLLLASVFSFVCAYLLPNHYFPWVSAYQDFLAFLAAFLLLAFVFLNNKHVVVPPIFFVFIFIASIPLWQFEFGVVYFFGDAWVATLYMLCFSFMVLLGYGFGLDPGLSRRFISALFAALILAAVFSVWIALRQWLMLPGNVWVVDMRVAGRPFANLAQPNNLATLLCMSVAAVWYFFERRLIGFFSSSVLAAFLIFGVVLTQSRTPWVASFVLAMFVVFGGFSRNLRARLSKGSFLLWLGFYAGSVLVLPFVADIFLISTESPFDRALALQRWPLWVQLWAAVWDGPLWGYGWGQVSVAQVSISPVYPVRLMVEHSHNILLDLLIWNGPLLGGAIICVLAAWLARLGWRARSVESMFCLIAVGFVLVHGVLELPLEYGFFLFPVGLLLGVVAGGQRSSREYVFSRWFLGGVLVAGLGMFAWVWIEYRIIEEDHRLMRFETARIGEEGAEQAANDVVLLTQLREFIRFARTPAAERMSDEQLEWMRTVAHRYPYPPSLFRYSLALALNGKIVLASEQLIVLRALHGETHFEESLQALERTATKYPQLLDVLELLAR